jgi:hypothetical protein
MRGFIIIELKEIQYPAGSGELPALQASLKPHALHGFGLAPEFNSR